MMHTISKSARLGLAMLTAGVAILAAAPGVAMAASPRADEGKMILVARQDPGTLDYTKSNLTALRLWIPANVVEPLVYFNKDGSVSPGVAEAWTISDDRLTYSFTIRDAVFSNGEKLTVEDVIYSLNAMKESPVSQNASAYQAVSAIEKTDERTVTVTLSRPSQNFWRGMGSTAGLIQPEASAGSIATNPIGTGPYKLVSYTSNSTLEFVANDSYWGEAPTIREVTVRIITDGTAGLNALEAGEVDSLPVITIDLWEQLMARGLDTDFSMVTYPQIGEPTYAVINQKLDPELRQALAMTIDRQAYNDAFGASWGAENTCTFALPNQAWYAAESAETCPYPYDLEGVMALVAEKGFADTPLEYASLSDVPDLSLPADIMVPTMQAAGFNMSRNAIDLARYSQLIFQGRPPQFDVTIMSGDADPTQFACSDAASAGWSTYCSAEYTQALSDADEALTDADYLALMEKSADILRKDAVVVPIIAKKGVGLFEPELKGFLEPRVAVAIEFAPLHW